MDVHGCPDTEDLLNRFEDLMNLHKFEAKTSMQKVKHHTRNILFIIEKLGGPLSRQFAVDPGVMDQVSRMKENISEKGHYAASLGWSGLRFRL